MGKKYDASLVERRAWVRDRRRFLEQVQRQVHLRTGERPSHYERRFSQEFRGRWTESSRLELLEDLQNVRIVFGADFHAFHQSQKTHQRILRDLPKRRKVVLALECFESKHQKLLDAYIAGKIDESEFVHAIQWEERWGFPFENYRGLLNLARDRGFQVIALNEYHVARTDRSLHRRDERAAVILSKVLRHHPKHLVYVIFGDFHLVGSHLPERVLKHAGLSAQQMIRIFQNEETLYFRYSKAAPSLLPEVLKGTAGRYVMMTSPPWVKWQSYLMFLEHAYDRDLESPELDPTDHVLALVRVLASDLKVKIKESELAVYSPESISFTAKMSRALSRTEFRAVQVLMKEERTFLLPSLQMAYLSRLSFNHAAGLAGQFVHAQLSGRRENYVAGPAAFQIQIWLEAVGFFLSKLMNPRRKSETLQSLRRQALNSEMQKTRKSALMRALDQRVSEMVSINLGRRRATRWRRRSIRDDFEAAKILGHMLGERMFSRLESADFELKDYRDLFEYRITAKDFSDFYYDVLRRFEQ